MVFIFIMVWFGLFFRTVKKNPQLLYNPILWLFFGWGFSFGLYCFSGIDYKYKLSLAAGIYYWLVPISAYLGFRVAKKYRFKVNRQSKYLFPRINELSRSTHRLFSIFAWLGCILYIFDISRLNTISMALHGSLNVSGLGNIGILLSGLGLILWLYECMRAIISNNKFRVSSYLSALSYLTPALLTSGRQSILIFAVSTFVVMIYCFSKVRRYRYINRLKLLLALAGIILFVYITFISASRTVVSNKIDLFNYMYNSSLSESTVTLLDNLGVFKTFVMEALYYYSHELSMFEILFSTYKGPKFWGMSQLTLVARNIPIGNGQTIFDLMWKHLDQISSQANVYSHVWRSAAGNCFMDFGIVGGLIYAFVCGYAVGRFYKKNQNASSIYNTVGLALLSAGMLFAMQFSPICEGYWLYPFFWWLVLPFVDKVINKS